MKRIVIIITLFASGLFFSRCLGILDSVSGIDVKGIQRRGKLIAITSYGANSYFIYRGTFMGFEYDLLSLLARELDVKLEVRVTRDIDNIINMLNSGDGDIVASNIAVTKERAKEFDFTDHFITTRQVIVQRTYLQGSNEKYSLIRNPIDLIGKKVHVRKESRYFSRLMNLSEEIGGDIIIKSVPGDIITEELIHDVAKGKIMYTIADEPTARINQLYYQNVDINTPISFPQRIAWVVTKKSPKFRKAINVWIKKIRVNGTLKAIYDKYYKTGRIVELRMKSEFHSLSGGKISPYDKFIKAGGQKLGWDWRLLASLMYQESRFKPRARSWAGARGLMQLMPSTARSVGVRNSYNPQQNIEGGIRHLISLNRIWKKEIKNDEERTKFILAAYNAGSGHVSDARKLAKKNHKSPDIWYGHVDEFILKLANPTYYNDSVVQYGYCRGNEPYLYVKQILERYQRYKQFIK